MPRCRPLAVLFLCLATAGLAVPATPRPPSATSTIIPGVDPTGPGSTGPTTIEAIGPAPAESAAVTRPGLPPPVFVLGQPRRWRLSWSPLAGYDSQRQEGMSRVALTLADEPGIPQIGLGQMSLRLHGGQSGGEFDYGLGAAMRIPWIQAGVEYNVPRDRVIPLLALEFSPRRGGLLHDGDQLRIEVRPWDGQVMAGLTLIQPLHRYRRTRPLRTYVELPAGEVPAADRGLSRAGLAPDLEASLERIEHAVEWMDRLLTPSFDAGREFPSSAEAYRSHIRQPGHTFAAEDSTYHAELQRAFALAVDDSARGRELAVKAEAVLLERVLLPFNRCFAARKKPASPGGLTRSALQAFDEHLAGLSTPPLPPETAARAYEVFRRTLRAVDHVARTTHRRWDQKFILLYPESRLVWIPMNYGLRRDQLGTQADWDSLMQRLNGAEVTDANQVEYLVNEQFHLRLKEMIRETGSYHVLYIHDVRGQYRDGRTDRIGWDLVVDGYLRAFTGAVRAIDDGRRRQMPQFFLFLDENYYQENHSREIVSFLERLYEPDELNLADGAVQDTVMAAHRALRRAIAASPCFRGLSESELRRLFRIQVNVTHPFDLSFSGDAPLRDHRKIAFRDVFEDDPAAGCGIATGQGVGEHYNGTGWDDRGLLVRGPALVALKTATRRLLESHDVDDRDVPWCLRPQAAPGNRAEQHQALRANGWTTPVSVVLNDVGHGLKLATATKALQYNLLPPGGTLLSYDSLWISDYWAGMLIAAALRGVHVIIMAPTPANAPSSAAPTMLLLRENLHRLIQAADFFRQEIAAAGGSLAVGIYATPVSVRDLHGRASAFLETWNREEALRARFRLDRAVLDSLHQALIDSTLVMGPGEPGVGIIPIESDHPPFLHMKIQFLASAEQMARLQRPEWAAIMADYSGRRAVQIRGAVTPPLSPAILQPLAPDTSGVVSFVIGSLNQDRRGMLMDGEVLLTLSGSDAWTAAPDLILLLGCASWPASEAEFARVFPEVKGPGILKRIIRRLKDAI